MGLILSPAAAPADIVLSSRLADWVGERSGDGAGTRRRVAALLAEASSDDAGVGRLVELFSECDPRIGALMREVRQAPADVLAGPPEWLLSEETPTEVRGNVGLMVAGRLHAGRRYEAVLAWLDGVEPMNLPAPYLLHYYRAVAQHQLARLEEALLSAEALLAEGDGAGRRHRAIAELIVRDSRATSPGSPDFIARQMNDIQRRLRLGRTGEPAQALQQQVLDALDKLIEDAEQQQKQQQQSASSPGPAAPAKPMEESRLAEMKGPGEVDRRSITAGGAWGDLPPEERQRVVQQIGRDFPAYYRELIEQYFRSLAQGEAPEEANQPGEAPQGEPR